MMVNQILCALFLGLPLVFLFVFALCGILFLAHHGLIFDFLSKIFIPVTILGLILGAFFMSVVPSASAGFFDSLGYGSSCSSSPDADPEVPPRLEASQNASQEASQEEASQEASQETGQEEGSQEASQEASQEEGSQEASQETGQEECSQDSNQEDQQAVLADLLNRIFYEVRTIRSLLNAQVSETDFIGTAEASEEVSDASDLETGDSSGSDGNISLFSVPADTSDSGSDSDSSSSSAEGDSSASAEDVLAEVTLLTIHTDIWLLLFSLWGFAGMFFAFKVGGAVLGRL